MSHADVLEKRVRQNPPSHSRCSLGGAALQRCENSHSPPTTPVIPNRAECPVRNLLSTLLTAPHRRHPERSRPSSGARDLPRIGTAPLWGLPPPGCPFRPNLECLIRARTLPSASSGQALSVALDVAFDFELMGPSGPAQAPP